MQLADMMVGLHTMPALKISMGLLAHGLIIKKAYRGERPANVQLNLGRMTLIAFKTDS